MGKVVEEEVLKGESDSRQYQYRGMRHKVSSLSKYNQNQSTHRILESVYRVGNFLFFLESIQCHDKCSKYNCKYNCEYNRTFNCKCGCKYSTCTLPFVHQPVPVPVPIPYPVQISEIFNIKKLKTVEHLNGIGSISV